MVDGYYPSFAWTNLYSVIQQWEQFGVFTVLFPLVLVFAIVFAILEKINIFNNRGVHLLIAIIVGFFTVANPYVSGFFMYFFSNLGLAVVILIALIILLGVALKPEEDTWKHIFLIVGIGLFLIVLARSGALKMILGEGFWYWFQANSAVIVLLVFVVIMMAAVVSGVKKAGKGFKVTPSEG